MNRVAALALLLVCLVMASDASAAANAQHEIAVTWYQALSHAARLTMLQPQLRLWIDVFFWVLAFTALSIVAADMLRGRADIWDYGTAILFIAVVRGGYLSYDAITHTAFGASKAIGGLYTAAILGYTAEPWTELLDVLAHVQMPALSLWDATVGDVIATIVLMIATGLIAVCAFICATYNEWQYFIVKIIGLIFVPTLLIAFTRQYFMNWLSLFLGVCMFNLVLGIVAPLLLLVVKIALGFEHTAPIGSQGVLVLEIDNPLTFMAGPAFIIVGVMYLFRVSAIANHLAGSSGALTLSLRTIAQQALRK